ncbi:unnamed protein product [Somion occarium]|uniref:Uncharacterized protein n=1 Tax=Somion occarium TaxID=3059160 RepID=A0ABP1CSD3_9APHY
MGDVPFCVHPPPFRSRQQPTDRPSVKINKVLHPVEKLFDPAANLPLPLQRRIDSWKAHPPKSQFQVYGPLNAYLQGHKFLPNRFIVKPQALLREEDAGEPDDSDADSDAGDRSFDSQGVGVTDVRRYPDFIVCQYWGRGGIDNNNKWDVVRILIEVASKEEDNWALLRQVSDNLDRIGPERWRKRILGIAMIKNKACVLCNDPNSNKFRNLYGWISIFDPRFVEEINRIYTLSVETDGDVWAGDEDEDEDEDEDGDDDL